MKTREESKTLDIRAESEKQVFYKKFERQVRNGLRNQPFISASNRFVTASAFLKCQGEAGLMAKAN